MDAYWSFTTETARQNSMLTSAGVQFEEEAIAWRTSDAFLRSEVCRAWSWFCMYRGVRARPSMFEAWRRPIEVVMVAVEGLQRRKLRHQHTRAKRKRSRRKFFQ